jgi:uncharacterized membrane-anchored protein
MPSTNSSADSISPMRVPEVTLIFWIIKTLSTTVGETGADFLAFDLGWGMPVTTMIMIGIMGALLYLQFFKFKKYVVANYWTLVVLMSIVGTLITDMLVDMAGVSLVPLSAVFTVMMLAGFYVWYRREGTLSIHAINTGKREFYYWVVILLAFALGTGLGDLISEHFALGYDRALLLFAVMIAAVTLAFYKFKLNAVTAFWVAYVLTRPLGASLGDCLIQVPSDGGLGIDMMTVNMVFFSAIVVLVGFEWARIRQAAIPARR